MNRIVSIRPTENLFSVTWMLGSRCNYDCMYCDPEWHDMTSVPHDLDTLKQVWNNIYEASRGRNLLYKISFTGGEVTANKNFLPLIEWLRSEFKDVAMISITTNGSASLNYYQRLARLVESISFSTHSEFMDEQEFFDKVHAIDQIMIRPDKSVHVNIMDEFWNRDRLLLYQAWLDARSISHSVNTIDYSHQTRTYPMIKGEKNLG